MFSPRRGIRPSFFAGSKGRRTVYFRHLDVAFAQEVADRVGVNTGAVDIEAGKPPALERHGLVGSLGWSGAPLEEPTQQR